VAQQTKFSLGSQLSRSLINWRRLVDAIGGLWQLKAADEGSI